MNKSDWVRQVRKRQGLKGFELADLLDVSPARVSVIEKDEARGALTLKMMDKVAKAMGCRFEYQIVPDRTVNTGETAKPRYRVIDNKMVAESGDGDGTL